MINLNEESIHNLRDLKDAHKEMELIRGSLSYRLGNALITPIKTAGVIAKNPKAIKKLFESFKSQSDTATSSNDTT